MVDKFPTVFPGQQMEKRMFPHRKAYTTLPCATALACDIHICVFSFQYNACPMYFLFQCQYILLLYSVAPAVLYLQHPEPAALPKLFYNQYLVPNFAVPVYPVYITDHHWSIIFLPCLKNPVMTAFLILSCLFYSSELMQVVSQILASYEF